MKHLKKFNEEIGNVKYLNFVQKLNKLFDFNEFEEGDEPSNTDLLSEIGDLCNEFDMDEGDIQEVLTNFKISTEAGNLLSIVLDETKKDNVDEDPCKKEAKYFVEWVRQECVIGDEGYYWDGDTYDINDIYDIYIREKDQPSRMN
jgi:hypothetical protein